MIAIPLPFVCAILLLVLLARLMAQRERHLWPAICFVGACALLVTVVGLRWSFNIPAMRHVQVVVAAVLPPLAWVLFSGLTRRHRRTWQLLHAAPFALVVIGLALSPWVRSPLDVVLAASYFGYGIALLRLAASGPDGFVAARFSDAGPAHRAALAAGLILVVSGALDLIIAAAFAVFDAGAVRAIVGAANLITLPLLAYAVAVVGQTLSADAETEPPDQAPSPGASTNPSDADVIARIDALMRDKQLYKDPDLTLNRLARRALIPTRQISGAVNRVLGRNVSQMVNEYRVETAKALLSTTNLPVTTIMFDAGFQTKSNFNREFLRVVGQSPSDFRRSDPPEARAIPMPGSTPPETA